MAISSPMRAYDRHRAAQAAVEDTPEYRDYRIARAAYLKARWAYSRSAGYGAYLRESREWFVWAGAGACILALIILLAVWLA